LRVRFLGGAREIGRSAILVSEGGTRILLDMGVILEPVPGFPAHVRPRDLSAVVITHAHLDHSGASPILYTSWKVPLYATKVTLSLMKLLLLDFIKVSGPLLPFEVIEVENLMECAEPVNFGEPIDIGNLTVTLYSSGHIPGAAQVLVESKRTGKRLLYTGDLNTLPTRLVGPADTQVPIPDALIIESTYANENHPDRMMEEERFVEAVREVVERGGIALIPSLAVGRAQEILCILTAHHFEYDVVLDGMARQASAIIRSYTEFVRNPDLLKRALSYAHWVSSWRDRREVVRQRPLAIVSSAGMLKGGPVLYYLKHVVNDPKSSIFLVSYQIPGTPGDVLLRTGRVFVEGKEVRVKAEVERFDFSAHAGADQLMKFVRKVASKDRTKILPVHGEGDNCPLFASRLQSEGFKALAPQPLDEVRV